MKKLTAYPAVRTLLLVPPMFVLLSVFGTRVPVRAPSERREMTAMVFLKVLAVSQRGFEASCGNGGYARTVEQLATPPPGSSDAFIDPASLENVKRNYVVTITSTGSTGPVDCNGRPTARSFSATAVPIIFLESGRRSFTLAEDGTVWYSESAVAPTEPFERSGKRIE